MTQQFRKRALKLGVEVIGANLLTFSKDDEIKFIKDLVRSERLVVFRNQPEISGQEQVRISKWFGQLDSDAYYKHPKSPCYDVFRVSNEGTEGCRGVGRTGWHIDGTFREKPYSYSVYYMACVPEQGDTRFVGLTEVLESLPPEKFEKWDKLYMLSDSRGSPLLHPLIYAHPNTGKLTMCFHLGMTDGFVYDYGGPDQRTLSSNETRSIFREIHEFIVGNNEALVYSHKWTPGDLVITDNLAVGHEASPESQMPVSKVGLRVLHRVTVAGQHRPAKQQAVNV